ncbi:iron chaperone [Algoriphagus marinus]|uniref:iron chaperone n=1 Tax=Algoriphagus marinus TaxID=1925762 RepID=UPI00094BB33A|nr:DUF1801 domain-containing protein [Algoriphagus marinus]
MMNPKASSVAEYFSWQTETIQEKLQSIRETIAAVVPEAKEVISYHMPAFKTSEVLVYYAAMKKHIGFYPHSEAIIVFKKELAPYKTSKGAIQFPLDQPIPLDLIRDITIFRREQVRAKKE